MFDVTSNEVTSIEVRCICRGPMRLSPYNPPQTLVAEADRG